MVRRKRFHFTDSSRSQSLEYRAIEVIGHIRIATKTRFVVVARHTFQKHYFN